MPIVQGTQLSIDTSSYISKNEFKRALSHLDQVNRYGIHQLNLYCTQEGYESLEKINRSKIALLWQMIKAYIGLSFHWINKATLQTSQHKIQEILDKDFATIRQVMQKVLQQPVEHREGAHMLLKAYNVLQNWQQTVEQTSIPYLQRHTYNCLETAWKQAHRFSKAELDEIKSMKASDYFLNFELKQLTQQSDLQLVENWEKSHANEISQFPSLSLKIEEYYKSLALKENAEAAFLLAKYYNKKVEMKDSEKFMVKAAEQGHKEAQRELSYRYLGGIHYPQSQEKALIWLERLAQQQDCEALVTAAIIYFKSGDTEKCLNYLQQAASLNDPYAIELLNQFNSSKEESNQEGVQTPAPRFIIPVNRPQKPSQALQRKESESQTSSKQDLEGRRQMLLQAIQNRQQHPSEAN